MSSKQVLGAVALVAALGGIVGGVAYASQPRHEAQMVIVPAAQVVPSPAASATATPTSVPTTVTAPVATTSAPAATTAAPKVIQAAPVQSVAPAPASVQQQTTVKRYAVTAQPATADPTPTSTGTPAPAPSPSQTVAPTDPNYSIPRPPLPPGTPAPNITGDPTPTK